LLETQKGEAAVWRWILQEEVLLEAGDERFMEQAVELLSRVLRRAEGAAAAANGDVEAGGIAPGHLAWELPVQASDWYISRLLALMPRDANLEGRVAGELQQTGALRSNARGDLDEDRGLCLTGLLRCNVL